MNSYLNGYVRGLFNMASSRSKVIGRSYIEAYSFEKESFKEEFSKWFKIKEFQLEKVNNDYLNNYLEQDIIDNILYWIKFKLGNVVSYYIMDNTDLKNTTFYIIDDVIVLEYNEYMLCLIIGNNE